MTLAQMRYFKAVCQYGGISKAASEIHVSQPSISIVIKDLEKEFGVALFKRENKRLILTQEGAFFYERVSILLNEVEALSLQMNSMGCDRNQLSLAMPIFIAGYLFANYLGKFAEAYPDITLTVEQCNFAKTLKRLESGACNMAIVADNGQIPPTYKRLTILSSEFWYCVSPDNSMAGCGEVDFSKLCGQPLIVSQDDTYITKQVKKRFYDLGKVPNIIYQAVQLSLIEELLSSGVGGTFLVKEIANGIPGIVSIPVNPPIPLDFLLVWKEGTLLNRSAKLFIEHMMEISAPGAGGTAEFRGRTETAAK